MSSNDSQKLRNCPFCGSEGKLRVADGILDDFTMFYCYCPNGKCIAGGTDWFRSREEAIEAWNTRAERTCKLEKTISKPSTMRNAMEYECSECGGLTDSQIFDENDLPRYCVNCGARVVWE